MSLQQFLCELSNLAYDDAEASFNSAKICDMFSALGNGCTRWVFEITYEDKAYAVKFAFHSNRHNRRERRAWRTASEEVRAMMAEVYSISTCGRVLAMELVPDTLSTADRWNECRDWNQDLRNALEASGFTPNEVSCKIVDNHPDNIGVRENGEVVWIDYAVW